MASLPDTNVDERCHDVAKDEGALRRILGWSPRTMTRAQGLTGLTSKELCALPLIARDQLRDIVKDGQKADANGMIEYLESRHRDETGKVPVDAMFNAVQQHKAMLDQQASRQQMSASMVAGISPPVWTAMGPKNSYSGRVRALYVDPRNPATMLVGTASGGMWRTVDAGASWQPVNGFSPAFSVTGLRADPNNPNTIYASTGEIYFQGAGIWRSLDSGVTWQAIPAVAPGQRVPGRIAGIDAIINQLNDVAVSPASSQIIVSATGRSGVLVSRDGGVSWQQVATPDYHVSGSVTYWTLPSTYFVSFDPKDGRKVFVGTDRGTLIVGTGLGTVSEQWQEQQIVTPVTGTPAALVSTMAWSTNGSSAWITSSDGMGTIYRSIDGGLTFVKLSTPAYCGGQCWYNNSLWVDPTDANRIVVGGVNLYRSIDGGLTWEAIDNGLNWSWNHVDHHAVLADPGYNGTTNKTVYFGNDGGVYRTTDITAPSWKYTSVATTPSNAFTWENFGRGIDATQFYAVASNASAGIILGGTQDNGTFRYQSGTDWSTLTGGDGGYAGVPNSGTPLYSSYQGLMILRTPYSATQTSADLICNGITESDQGYRYDWNAATSTWDRTLICGTAGKGSQSQFIAPLKLDPNDDKRMYAGGVSLWASNDVSTGTPTWRAIKSPLPPDSSGYVHKVSAIAVAPTDANQVWVGYTNGETYHTVTALAATPSWTLTKAAQNSFPVTSIFISPAAPQRVTITLSGYSSGTNASNVYRTLDAGVTWADISGNLPKTVAHTVVEHPTNPAYVYVGTDTGIYATTDGVTWSASNDGPALVPVYMLSWFDNSTLLAATHGRGVWRATLGVTTPTITSIRPGSSKVTIYFNPSVSSTGALTYTVSCTASGQATRTVTGTGSPMTVAGLTPGVAYSCSVSASDGTFASSVSASMSATPVRSVGLVPIMMLLLD